MKYQRVTEGITIHLVEAAATHKAMALATGQCQSYQCGPEVRLELSMPEHPEEGTSPALYTER